MPDSISEQSLVNVGAFSIKLRKPEIAVTYFPSLDAAAKFANSPSAHDSAFIALNAEKILKIYKNPDLFSEVHKPVFYPDGAPVLWLAPKKMPRLPGVELWLQILKLQDEKGGTVLVFGATAEVSKRAYTRLSRDFPEVHLTCVDGFQGEETYFSHLDKSKPSAVFVAMGSPRQELLISRFQTQYPTCFYMGIGGSLDILTGEKKRAPDFFLKYNVEFLYRLLKEPWRFLRQLALLKFLGHFLIGTFKAKPVVLADEQGSQN